MNPKILPSTLWLNRYGFCLAVLWTVIVLVLGPVRAGDDIQLHDREDLLQVFGQANAHYLEGEFPKAVLSYRQILDSGYESGPLYYNMGNACFRTGQKGRALSYYYKALQFIPGDADLWDNLQVALTDLEQTPPNWWEQHWPRLVYWLSFNQWTILTSACFFLFITGLGGRVWFGLSLTRGSKGWDLWSLGVWRTSSILMVFMLALTVVSGWNPLSRQGVIINPTVNAGYQPDPAAAVSLELKEGSRIYILEQNGEWSLIRQPGGKQGWVPRDSYQSI